MSRPITDPLREERGMTLAELAVTLGLFGMIMLGVIATWSQAQQAYFIGSEAAEVQQNARAAIDFMGRELRAVGRDVTACTFDYAGPVSLDCGSAKVSSCQTKLGGNYNNSSAPVGTGAGCTGLFAVPYVTGLYPIVDRIRIRSDRNDNGRIVGAGNSIAGDQAEEDVTYALAPAGSCPSGIPGACITRDDGSGPVAMVAVDISGFQLTYFPKPGYGPCVGVGSPPVPPNPCPAYGSIASQNDADNIARVRIEVTAQQTTAGQTVTRTLTTDIVLQNRK